MSAQSPEEMSAGVVIPGLASGIRADSAALKRAITEQLDQWVLDGLIEPEFEVKCLWDPEKGVHVAQLNMKLVLAPIAELRQGDDERP